MGMKMFSIETLPEELAGKLRPLPAEDVRVVTMEIFGEADFNDSMRVLQERRLSDL